LADCGRYDFTNNYTSSPVARLSPADARHVSDYGYTTIRGQHPSPPEPVYAIGSLEWQRQQEQAREALSKTLDR